jgi:hypothetical protein
MGEDRGGGENQRTSPSPFVLSHFNLHSRSYYGEVDQERGIIGMPFIPALAFGIPLCGIEAGHFGIQ